MSASSSVESSSDLVFSPGPDPFPNADVFKEGEAELDDKFRQLAKTYYGETEDQMRDLVAELKEELKRQG